MTEGDVKALAVKGLTAAGGGLAVMLPVLTSGHITGESTTEAFAALTTVVLFGFGVWDFLHVKSVVAAATGSTK